ncbi:MAG: MmcQ/YjbR family DNA-binding protein [Chloroflexota bacterium]|jgi:predicted DNA-binding protein (MmcQ/YjbR family)|nr:MmcQ/YjbR family DNA-binding protein [Chloroflexota bacterium]
MPSLANDVRAFAFSLPEAWEDHPWGESVAKVGKKVFLFLGTDQPGDGGCWLGVKLPVSNEDALALTFSRPMGYGLDRGGWVGIQAPPDMPLEVLTAWVEESYRAVAPKALVRQLDEARGTASA